MLHPPAPTQKPATVKLNVDQRPDLKFRRMTIGCCSAMAALTLAEVSAIAQDAPQAGASSNVVSAQPFPYGGLMLLVVMMGLSLFAVCRSSRRN